MELATVAEALEFGSDDAILGRAGGWDDLGNGHGDFFGYPFRNGDRDIGCNRIGLVGGDGNVVVGQRGLREGVEASDPPRLHLVLGGGCDLVLDGGLVLGDPFLNGARLFDFFEFGAIFGDVSSHEDFFHFAAKGITKRAEDLIGFRWVGSWGLLREG